MKTTIVPGNNVDMRLVIFIIDQSAIIFFMSERNCVKMEKQQFLMFEKLEPDHFWQ